MVRQMIEEDIDPRHFCNRIGLGNDFWQFLKIKKNSEIPDGYETIDIFRMLMRCLGGCRERRKRREKYNLAQTIELIKKSKKILVLTGAGISVSCGIPDFRSRDGLYAKEGVFFRFWNFFLQTFSL